MKWVCLIQAWLPDITPAELSDFNLHREESQLMYSIEYPFQGYDMYLPYTHGGTPSSFHRGLSSLVIEIYFESLLPVSQTPSCEHKIL